MIYDLRFAIRKLRKSPGFTALAAATLGLGIAATTSVFSLVNAMLWQPLPGVADPARLVSVYRAQQSDPYSSMGFPDYSDYRDRTKTFASLAAHCPAPMSLHYRDAQRVRGDVVTGNYFDLLGARPALGRLLLPADDVAGAPAVGVIGHGLWLRMFGGDPAAVGAHVTINGAPFTIVGVTSKDFGGTLTGYSFDLWTPLATQPITLPWLSAGIKKDRGAGWLRVFGRLRPDVGFEQATAEMKTIAGQLAAAYPITNETRSINLVKRVGIAPDQQAEIAGLLRMLGISVGLLLLIACANVAGLFVARAANRRREIAIRLAVGAQRVDIVRQLLVEGLLLAALAGALGLILSVWTAQWMAGMSLKATIMRGLNVRLDANVLLFALGASVLAGVLFALLPALLSSSLDLSGAIRDGAAGAGVRRSLLRPALRPALVVAQVAVSFVLLSGGALLLRNLVHLMTADPGFETRNIAIATLDLNLQRYSEDRARDLLHRLLPRLSGLPGVSSASLATTVPPYDFSGRVSIFLPGQEPSPELFHGREMELGVRVDINHVAPRYFSTMGMSLQQGRDFDDRDKAGSAGVAVITEKLARRLWPGESPLGKRIVWPDWNGAPRAPLEVIGVARDAAYRNLTGEPPLLMYVSIAQFHDNRPVLLVRTVSQPANALAGMSAAVKDLDPDLSLYAPRTMSENIAESLWQERMAATWIGAFSVLALALAAIGLYGVVAQSVSRRTREIGIRMALGAERKSVVNLVIGEGLRLVTVGLLVGIPVAIGGVRVFRQLLADGGDPVSFAGVALALTLVMLAACWVPARRASRVDPVEALRSE
jgi:macrolide transport system ATP-binding/permease protein